MFYAVTLPYIMHINIIYFRVGLIEWVGNTVPLKEFINNSMTEQETKFMASAYVFVSCAWC